MKTRAFKAALPYTIPICVGCYIRNHANKIFGFSHFSRREKPPSYITYLGTVLPYAVIGLLVAYCLKGTVFTSYHGLPELIAIGFISVLHKWKINTLLSITGTVLYMVLVQTCFR